MSGGLAVIGLAFVGVTMVTGVVLAITFFGLAVLALSIRSARGIGGLNRGLARSFLGEAVEDPEPFAGRPGFLGWLQSSLRDRVGWRAVGYLALKVPWTILGFYVAFSLWWDAFVCLTHPFLSPGNGTVPAFGLVRNVFPRLLRQCQWLRAWRGHPHPRRRLPLRRALGDARRSSTSTGCSSAACSGPIRYRRGCARSNRRRTQTVDASAATLRRIERDLHDGTQAQLVALAMRLGMAKEKLENADDVDLDRVRELVDEAHRGAKEAIAELRDIARGIHPPALDIGLEGALATLAARSAVPTDLSVDLRTRPTPAIEAIAYFCVAELLANVAQHAQASRASVSCAQQGTWLRLVVRDDGRGGAQLTTVGLHRPAAWPGLTDRVHAVDGRLNLVSPPGGPTVVTVDLPLSP